MSARALVVDDIAANVRLLEAKLLVEYYEVLTANDGATVLEIVAESMPDIVLLDVMMPGMEGFEVCQRIKENPATVYIPAVMVTALSEVSGRVKGLEAGADAFLTKPVNDLALFARIRSLVRLKRAIDEWRAREFTFTQFGLNNTIAPEDTDPSMLQVLLVADEYGPSQRIVDTLSEEGYSVEHSTSIDDATIKALDGDVHLILVDDRVGGNDVLRFCSQLRSSGVTRHSPILIMLDDGDTERLAKVLDLGVNDYLKRPVNKNELTARAKTQIRRKQFEDNLSQQYEKSLTVAVTDSLTGLYNRRYLETLFEELSSDLRGGGKPISLLIMDVDMAIRLGGEEFVMLMPNVDGRSAVIAANRLREMIDVTPFEIDDKGQTLKVTMSIGVATGAADEIGLNDLLERADQALYTVKNGGPNRVEVADDLPVDSDPLPEAARA
jgi:two-component system cell cycle response regulator